jgi:two-component system, chemotaxis family, CheB/CheR fusion protein
VVRPEIRQMVIFARHNLVGDPPFTRMDLVTCRNALIYFQPMAQERALRRLQYALVRGGHLMLGPSESLGVMHRDFHALPGRHKVYRLLRRERLAISMDSPARHLPTVRRALRRPSPAALGLDAAPWVVAGQRELQASYVPPSLLVGPARELLHVYGSGRELLQIGEGQATLDVLRLLPPELSWAAGLLLQAVASDQRPQRSAALRIGAGDTARRLRLVARPVVADEEHSRSDDAGLVLLSFEPVAEDSTATDTAVDMPALDAAQQRRVEALERELDITNDSLQATIEELETANEELQATNEELMASNEELQSTNEELQSVNEELYTVNSEFQEKVDVLNSVNADLENISKAAAIPTMFVDEALRLTRFTPELSQLFKVRESDRGRSIEDFANMLDYPELFSDLRRTLAGAVVTEREVKSRSGEWWLARIQPYAGRQPGSSRAVMTFVNVSSLKDSQRLQAIIDSLAEHIAVVDGQGNITLVNEAWRRFAATNGDEALRVCGPGTNYLRVCAQAALVDEEARRAHEGLASVLAGRLQRFTLHYPCHTENRKLWFLMHVGPVAHPGGGAVVSHTDITSWMQGQTAAPSTEPTA